MRSKAARNEVHLNSIRFNRNALTTATSEEQANEGRQKPKLVSLCLNEGLCGVVS